MGPKIQRVRLNNFRSSGSILTGLCSVDAPWSRGDKKGTILTMPAPKNLWRQKIVHNFRDFWELSTLISNISGTDQHIKNRKSSWSSTTHPTLGEKNLAYFGPQMKKLIPLINLHPNGLDFFRETISRPLVGAAPWNYFYTRYIETDQGYLVHTQTGTGVPPKKF